ncbi:MAG: citramalate synthase [Pseudomonadota bacterium]
MTRERLYIYDTTLRDGQQTQGVAFSVNEKHQIATLLDGLGIDYIEGGWPGANPTDSAFCAAPPKLETAVFAAFGMTKRVGRSAENDDVLAAVTNAGTPAVCLVGKTHDFHVSTALGVTLDENIEAIRASITHLRTLGREAIFDAEHFFDGYRANPGYALECLKAAYDAGVRWIVLCDTNGGTLPAEIGRTVTEVIEAGIPGDRLGIHTHDDTGTAVAGALAAVDAGVRQIQGTLNGLGERCGNTNLTSLLPSLLLKRDYADRLETGLNEASLRDLTRASRLLDDILNRNPDPHAPYVGASAFAHKAGLHASAVEKDPSTYEHVVPETVGNARIVPMSNQAGRSNLRRRLRDAGLDVAGDDPRLQHILDEVKRREDQGFAYDGAPASFELVAREVLGLLPVFFEVDRYRVSVEKRRNAKGQQVTVSEAMVAVIMDDERHITVADSHVGREVDDCGPVDALARALRQAIGPHHAAALGEMRLVDFKVRIQGGGTEAVTRVQIDSEDGTGRHWSTVGASANIVDASFMALMDAIVWKLVQDG